MSDYNLDSFFNCFADIARYAGQDLGKVKILAHAAKTNPLILKELNGLFVVLSSPE